MKLFAQAGCPGRKGRTIAVKAFQARVDRGDFSSVTSNLGLRGSREESLAFWQQLRKENPWMTDAYIKKLQARWKVAKRRETRQAERENGMGTKGRLLTNQRWRILSMGDREEEILKKLSFLPVAQVGCFGKDNCWRLQKIHDRLAQKMLSRQGKGGAIRATKTKKHQNGASMGLTVAPGNTPPAVFKERADHYSGTVQLKKYEGELHELRMELIRAVTACVEEAFGSTHWYKVLKEAFKEVPSNRRLPNTTMPASNIWWNWNDHDSTSHIDWNAVAACFVFTPHTYEGAELLCDGLKIPLTAGKIVGGSWQRFPHCNDKLWGEERFSIVVYFDYRVLDRAYWLRY